MGKAAEHLEGDALQEKVQEWVQKAEEEELLDSGALDELRRILREENLNRPSPEGAY